MHRRDFMGAAVGAGLFCSTGALFGERAFALSPGVLRRSRGGNLTSLDPQRSISATDMEIVADFFVGVTAIDARGEIIPGCAADWKISADGKRYEFRLRPGISWSDGRQLTAGDVVFSLQRLLTPSTAALLAYRYDAIRGARAVREGKATPATLGVRAIAADRVVFELERPETDLLKLLSVAYLVPAHAVTAVGRDWAKPPSVVVNGPWRPVSWAQNGTLVLEANPRWFGARSTAVVPRLEWVMGIDDAARLRAFRSGELDVAQIGEPAQYALAKKEAGPRLRSVPFYGGGWIGLNLRRPLLRDPRFRESRQPGATESPWAQSAG